jgi:hypothetical protein
LLPEYKERSWAVALFLKNHQSLVRGEFSLPLAHSDSKEVSEGADIQEDDPAQRREEVPDTDSD